MGELIWKVGFDEQSAERAGKKAAQSQSKEERRTQGKGGGGGAFKGGVVGSLLGSLLSSVKALFDPLTAIATLFIAALFPILKPFLILFIKVGIMLYKWLQGSLAGLGGTGAAISTDTTTGESKVGESLKSALFIIGGIIGAIVATLLGAPLLLTAAIAILAGLIVSKVGSYFIEKLLGIATWIDNLIGSNLVEPLKIYFQGISDTFNGLWNMLKSLLSLDFKGVWEGFKQFSRGIVGQIIGFFWTIWELIKTLALRFWDGLGVIGAWLWDTLKSIMSKALDALKGIGTWIKDKIKSMFSIFGGGGSKSVNDAIITPNGDIIRTNPSDYLIATKNPGALNMGGGSGGRTVNVNISGGLITEDVARQIGRIIQREISYGGGF
jgi:hypothetical protein